MFTLVHIGESPYMEDLYKPKSDAQASNASCF